MPGARIPGQMCAMSEGVKPGFKPALPNPSCADMLHTSDSCVESSHPSLRDAVLASAVSIAVLMSLVLAPKLRAQPTSLADCVNTLQGTASRFELSRGNTYPAVAMPWGTHTWTPQTGRNGDGWKYQYHLDTIRGFQQAHQCSSWSNDYCVFSLMPVVGTLVVDEDRRATRFRHDDETAKPHDYRVKLANGVSVEMAPSEHGAFLRFSFPDDAPGYLVFDGYTGFCSVKVLPDRQRIQGGVRNGRNLSEGFRCHFAMECDQPFKSSGTWCTSRQGEVATHEEPIADGRRVGCYVEFAPGMTVNVRVASSYIDSEQAELNLRRELGELPDIEAARAVAEEAWNKILGKLLVEGGSEEQRRTFYSCFFRACLFPRKFHEIDASGNPRYRSPYDGRVHEGMMFTDTGLWDTFRTQMPLNALLHPEMHGQYMQALLDAYGQCGWLPSWSFPGEAGSMIGNHAISLLADAWVKGIRTFDPGEALAAYDHESSVKGPWGPANGRGGTVDIERLGYLPFPKYNEATAKTLEYAYDDFCGYHLAQMKGDPALAERFRSRMFNYRNVFDPVTGFMRGRDENGDWEAGFDPRRWGGPFIEGCAWHWLWSVMHDVRGLVALLGGDEAFAEKLDAVFKASNEFLVGSYGFAIHEMREMSLAEMGQYAHGNQPMHHVLYLYNYVGQPWKSQYWAREVMRRLYNSREDGYPGDEDQGQMSSWFVMSALGFYSVCPGTTEYVLGSPVFDKSTIRLENGRRFTIRARNNSPENVYIQSALLDGEELTRNYLTHEEINRGGVLELEMGPSPNLSRGDGAAGSAVLRFRGELGADGTACGRDCWWPANASGFK